MLKAYKQTNTAQCGSDISQCTEIKSYRSWKIKDMPKNIALTAIEARIG